MCAAASPAQGAAGTDDLILSDQETGVPVRLRWKIPGIFWSVLTQLTLDSSLLSGPSRTIGPEVPLFDPASACQLRMELTLLLLVLGRCPPHLMTSPFLAEMLAARRIPDPGAEMMSCGLLTSSKEPVPLHHSSVSVLIRGFVADVGCQLLHRNEEPGPVEAVFKCPVDAEALSMPSRPGCGGPASRPSSRRRDRDVLVGRAQELHGDALAGGQSSFLLQQEEAGGDMFSCSLGNLSPGEEAMLTLSYTYELLLEHDGAARYVLPTVLHPRYTPHAPWPFTPGSPLCSGWDGENITPGGPAGPHGELPYTLSLSAMLQSPPQHPLLSNCPLSPLSYTARDHHCPGVAGPGPPVGPGLGAAGVLRGATQTQRGAGGRAARSRARLPDGRPGRDDDPAAQSAQGGAGPEAGRGVRPPAGPLRQHSLPHGRRDLSRQCINSTKETLVLLLKSLPLGYYFNIYGFGSEFESFYPAERGEYPADQGRVPAAPPAAPGSPGGHRDLGAAMSHLPQPLPGRAPTPAVRVYGRGGREHPGHHRRGAASPGDPQQVLLLRHRGWGLHGSDQRHRPGSRGQRRVHHRPEPHAAQAPRHSHGGHHPAVPHPGPDLQGHAAVLPAATGWRQAARSPAGCQVAAAGAGGGRGRGVGGGRAPGTGGQPELGGRLLPHGLRGGGHGAGAAGAGAAGETGCPAGRVGTGGVSLAEAGVSAKCRSLVEPGPPSGCCAGGERDRRQGEDTQ
ncbi:unnamed protein product [Lepidochelys kempii]